MTADRRNIISAVIAALLAIVFFRVFYLYQKTNSKSRAHMTVGIIYDGDESTPYSANFMQAAKQLKAEYGSRIDIIEKHNIPYSETENVIRELADANCGIIFSNSYGYGESAKKMAEQYPDIQFCEATCDNANSEPVLDNYHTFMGEIYQGRYLSGMVAGRKLSEMISQGVISEEQAQIGYVAAYPCAEVISGYTAFLLGVRSQCPNAVMKVKYTDSWTNYALEKTMATKLINEGCVMISHHTNTIGSALACEQANKSYPVYHISYNQDMTKVAPNAVLTGTRIEWAPYMIAAVGAVLEEEDIEKATGARVFGKDASGGYSDGWVKLIDINTAAAAEGTAEMIKQAEDDLAEGKIKVFFGDYTGCDFSDPNDKCDLSTEYIENEKSSAPTFHYVLDDIIIIE